MISVQTEDFDIAEETQALRVDAPQIGALVTFTGLVRDLNDGSDVYGLFLEHYPGMTEKALADICEQAKSRWPLDRIRIIHRVGQLHPTDQIVFVGVTSAHRGDAFQACEYLMDFLKTKAPFWKREETPDGSRWVDAKASDQQAADRWQAD